MVITLSFLSGLIFGNAALQATLASLKGKVDMNVYFLPTTAPDDILALKATLEKKAEVTSVTYTSREDALDALKGRHPDDGTVEAINELGDNPLGAVLNVQTKDPSHYEALARFLKTDNAVSPNGVSIIRKVNFYDHETAINALSRIINATNRLGFVLSIVFVAISLIIAFNTIRLTIYNSREEISVMKLVGATNKYVRGPFMVSGVMCGVAASLITLVLFFFLIYYSRDFAKNFFIGIDFLAYYKANFGQIFGIVVGSGVLIGAVSSYLAVRRYLKV
ncbi:MAG: permease-like cell division protein FtsX [bacterium]